MNAIGVTAELRIEGRADSGLQVHAWHAEEGLSQVFALEADLVSDRDDLDPDRLLGKSACLTVALGEARRSFPGIVWSLELDRSLASGLSLYRIELRPRMAVLEMSRERQIYGPDREASVVEVLRAALLGEGALGPTLEAQAGLSASDLAFRLQKSYPARPFLVQHEESDLDFLARLMEHWGIFYFFEHDEAGERMVLADDISVCRPCPGGPASLAFRQPTALSRPDELLVSALTAKTRRLPAKVILTDYNDQLPEVDLQVSAQVDPKGHGVVASFGEHYLTREEGQALANLRAAELACRKTLYSGESNAPHLLPGHRISLSDHPQDRFNREYLLTRVRFEAGQPHPEFRGRYQGYRNRFEALPADVTYAPARATRRPRVCGLETAWIDGTKGDGRGEIDDQGRHRVRMAWDRSGRPDAQAAPPLRRTQPSSHANGGMHFPLAMATEVSLGYLHGDPDRPLILGAVDNPATPGVVTDKARTLNRIRTAAGTTIEMNDGLGNPGLGSNVSLALRRPKRKRLRQRLGGLRNRWPSDLPRPPWWPPPWWPDDEGDEDGGAADSDDDAGVERVDPAEEGEVDLTTEGTSLRCYVTDYGNGDEESYLRFGSYDADNEEDAIADFIADTPDADRNGLFSTTDGAGIVIVRGDSSLYVAGNQLVAVLGDGSDPQQSKTLGDENTATSQYVTIYGDQAVGIGGASTHTIGGDYRLTIKGNYTETTNGTEHTEYQGEYSVVDGIKGGNYKKGAVSITRGDQLSFTFGISVSANISVKEDVRIALYLSIAPLVVADIGLRLDVRYLKASWAGLKVETALTEEKKAEAAQKAQEVEAEVDDVDLCSNIAVLCG